MPLELLHFCSFILCSASLGIAVVGIVLTIDTLSNSLTRRKFQAVLSFLPMILGGILGAYIGWMGFTSIPTPKKLELKAPADSVIRAEVIRNGQVIHQEEI